MIKTTLGTIGAGLYCYAMFGVQTVFAASEGHGDTGHGSGHGGAADAHHEGSSSGLPQLDVSTYPSQLFWLFVTFAILYVIFSMKTLPEISSTLEGRQEHIKSELDQAERSKAQAESAQRAYEGNLEQARVSAGKEMGNVQNDILKKSENAYKKFLEKSESDIKAMEKELEKMKLNAMDEMNTIAAELASEAAQKIVGINTDVKKVKSVVEALSENKSKGKAKAA